MATSRRPAAPALALIALAVFAVTSGCGNASTSNDASSSDASGPCAPDLPERPADTDFPVPILHVNGDDVPPVLGDVEWTGPDGEVIVNEPQRPAHLERFTVLQAVNQTDVSIRLSDDAEIAAWSIDAVPANTFRIGDLETDRRSWSEGEGPTSLVCVPVENGSWAVIGTITYADGAGSGTFYWRLNIVGAPGA